LKEIENLVKVLLEEKEEIQLKLSENFESKKECVINDSIVSNRKEEYEKEVKIKTEEDEKEVEMKTEEDDWGF